MQRKDTKITLKTHWSKVLDVHRDWLIQKGYSEPALKTREREGIFLERLKSSMEETIQNTLWEYRLEPFQLEITGFFDEQKDRVQFQFNYTLEPGTQKLFLSSMKATLDETEIEYLISNNSPQDLPPATLVYVQLHRLSNNVLLNRIRESTVTQKPNATPKRKQ